MSSLTSMKSPTEEDRIKAIANRIKELRKESGYTSYEKFALQHGLDRKQYWRFETGHNLTISSLHTILKAHNMSLHEFFKDLE